MLLLKENKTETLDFSALSKGSFKFCKDFFALTQIPRITLQIDDV
ncbi:hypothetical protein C723_2722 [Christiangramia flava JLT2011]|uniref:Uncharacterized protein n=1 Tax=Christiangramia flava JLT2011 TaxID=1229726 RepID=A0A1L7HZS8_9FLAO|nr:hypothetical protein GRFL_0124 [Christiangramia flava JLT2011]OSS38485.1 hypothetical protein C723_2722 [Christiangramia flava JLT2011]